jgi:hypothetical protein
LFIRENFIVLGSRKNARGLQRCITLVPAHQIDLSREQTNPPRGAGWYIKPRLTKKQRPQSGPSTFPDDFAMR